MFETEDIENAVRCILLDHDLAPIVMSELLTALAAVGVPNGPARVGIRGMIDHGELRLRHDRAVEATDVQRWIAGYTPIQASERKLRDIGFMARKVPFTSQVGDTRTLLEHIAWCEREVATMKKKIEELEGGR